MFSYMSPRKWQDYETYLFFPMDREKWGYDQNLYVFIIKWETDLYKHHF